MVMLVKDLLDTKGIPSRESGGDFLIRCLNPEHEDKNPSLRVDKITGVFNCLSCGFAGNIFSHFGEKVNGLGIKRDRLQSLIQKKLSSTVGLSMPEGYVPFTNKWRTIKPSTYKLFGAFKHHDYIGRVVFPITGTGGKIVAFCGRAEDNVTNPKYMFYPSGASLPLFPIVKPRQGRVMLVEGIYDMLNLHDKGLTNVMCCWGVNKVDEAKINLLKIQGVVHIDIFYDSDEAGRKGAKSLIDLLEKHELTYTDIVIDDIKDPGELTAAQVMQLERYLYESGSSGDEADENEF